MIRRGLQSQVGGFALEQAARTNPYAAPPVAKLEEQQYLRQQLYPHPDTLRRYQMYESQYRAQQQQQ